ncbi:MAG TPA: pyridoxal phosphate-dependent aminotransferase [Vicinamibacterales bacterium]|nr:pyridoxal phosphate-dependent aminotransferase [Vicinamibacterales bacterium]
MGQFLDDVPFSGIIRIRDMMYSVKDPFRLDQGDVSFDTPDTVKTAMHRAIDENRSHYLQTTGLPRLLELLAEKLRDRNGIPVGAPDEVMVTTGGIHGLFITCQALLEPGDEVIIPDPEWPPCAGNIKLAHGVAVPCSLHEKLGWRYDLAELESKITTKTRAIYINSPHNPTGGVLTRADIEAIAAMAERRGVWILSDEAYEDVVFDGGQHVSPASLPGMYDRTISLYTFSKTYAMTGLRLGYVAAKDAKLRDRMKKALFYTASNIASVVQFGGVGALEGSQAAVATFRDELQARRDLFYAGIRAHAGEIFSGEPPRGAFYAFLRINADWSHPSRKNESLSWAMTEYLISEGRIGCVPGVDFGANGEGYLRFCFARDRRELTGALDSMRALFSSADLPISRDVRHRRESFLPS